MYNNDLSVFSFRNNSGTAQYSMNNGSTWVNFKNPVGTKYIYSNGTYDVTNYASAYVSVSTSLSETTLWTNSSPSSSQAAATLTLDSGYFSSYDYIKFYFRNSNTNATECNILMKYSDFVNANGGDGYPRVTGHFVISGGFRGRSVTYVSSNQFKITGGNLFYYSSSTQSANTVAILTKITGLK